MSVSPCDFPWATCVEQQSDPVCDCLCWASVHLKGPCCTAMPPSTSGAKSPCHSEIHLNLPASCWGQSLKELLLVCELHEDKVISKTCILTAKTSENQSKQIHLPPLHLEKMSQESQINRACDKEDTSAYSGHPSMQRDEEMCIKQGTLEQRKNLQLSRDESKQKSHEFSMKLKMTECPEEEPPGDNSKGGASLRQMPSNLTSKMLNWEGKDAFGMSVSAALQTLPEREEPTLKIVSPSHADPGSQTDTPSSSSSEIPLTEKELYSENDHKPDTEHILNPNEESFYNDTENKKVRHSVVTSEVIEDQEFAKQMTKNMNPNTTDWKLGIGPTPQSSDPKRHFDLWLVRCNETKPMIELKSHDMPAVTNTYKEIRRNQDLFQKPLCADNCSANYCKSMDSKLKVESSSALHNDRTPGVYVIEENFQSLKNDVDMLKVEYLAWKKEKIQLQKEVKEKMQQKNSKREASGNVCDGADDSNSVGLSQQSHSEQTDNQQVSFMENADSYRFTLEEEKEKRQKVDVLYEKNRVQLRKKEEHSIKEVEMNPYLETTIRTRDIVSETVRQKEVVEEQDYTQIQRSQEQNTTIIQDGILTKHLCKPKKIKISHKKMHSEVSESSDKEKSLLHENRMLWDEIAQLKLEIDAVKTQTQEMGKKYFEDIAIFKENNDLLHKTIRETAFQHNAQLEVLRAELIKLNCKLEDEQQNRGRLEAEIESYRSRLATAVQDHEHCQTSKRDLQLAFQRARDEWFCSWDKINFDMSNLKQSNEILSQQLSKMESKSNNLEIKLHRTRNVVKERILALERDLSQKQCQKEKTEHMYQEEQGKVDKDVGKPESLQERLSHLHSENMLLHQQLDQAHSKADREEKTAIHIQDQIQDKINIFKDESVNQILNLKENINELINEWHHFKEKMHRYENDNIERDATVRQLQEELAVVRPLQQKISMIEASLEVKSHHPVLSQDKTHDLKKELDQRRSQNDELIAKLQPSSSKCIRLDKEKAPQQELSVEALLKRREELKDRVKKAKQEAINLRTHMETNMVESCEIEEYKKKTEERARRDIADTIEKVNSLLKAQRASQEMSEQMINNHPSTMSHWERRNKQVESEISKAKTSQDDIKRELEKYVQLRQEELEGIKLLENKLTDFPRTTKRLSEVGNKLFVEQQLNAVLLSKRTSTPGDNLGIPTSRSSTSTYHRNTDPIIYQHIHDSPSQAAFGSPALRTGSSGVTTGSGFLEDTPSFPAKATAPGTPQRGSHSFGLGYAGQTSGLGPGDQEGVA
ncbi:putative coiled-coil domain-containing protein 144C [Eptesicus fuscus]|uniref:putative coiled-coil domain-containing protein 144C n=1 Tax=Eptesicus fuscus TaxID=29078 RepID=UPI002403C4A5|nr:putative coiled-coil domain-containing protein 144C [Eptesicus fuscus]